MLQPVDEVRPQALDRARALDNRDALHQFLEQDAHLHPRQARTEAEVRAAAAERDVLVGRAPDVERERIGENILVAIRRDIPDADLVARLELLSAQLGVA